MIFNMLAAYESFNIFLRIWLIILIVNALVTAIFSQHLLMFFLVSKWCFLWWAFFLFRWDFLLNCWQISFFKISLLKWFQVINYLINKIWVLKLLISIKLTRLFVFRDVCISTKNLVLVSLYRKTESLFLNFKVLKFSKMSLKFLILSWVIYFMIEFVY